MASTPNNGTWKDGESIGREPDVSPLTNRQTELLGPPVNEVVRDADRDGQSDRRENTPPSLYGPVLRSGGLPEGTTKLDDLLAYGCVIAALGVAVCGVLRMVH